MAKSADGLGAELLGARSHAAVYYEERMRVARSEDEDEIARLRAKLARLGSQLYRALSQLEAMRATAELDHWGTQATLTLQRAGLEELLGEQGTAPPRPSPHPCVPSAEQTLPSRQWPIGPLRAQPSQ